HGKRFHVIRIGGAACGHQKRFELSLPNEGTGHRVEVLGDAAGGMMDHQTEGPVTLRPESSEIPAHEVRSGHKEIEHGVGPITKTRAHLSLHRSAQACTDLPY